MRNRALAALLALAPLALPAQAVQEFTLATGLRCLLVENHERPLIRAELAVTWDPLSEPDLDSGALGFLAAVLPQLGAGPHSRAEFNRSLDDLGLDLGFQARRDGFHWSLVGDSRSQEAAFELLAHAVFRPVFEAPVLEASRQALLQRVDGSDAPALALARLKWKLQDPQAVLAPDPALIQHLGLQPLIALQRRLIRPGQARLILYGDLSLAQAKELAFLHFGVWAPGPEPVPAKPAAIPAGPAFSAVLESGARAEAWLGAAPPSALRPAQEAILPLLLATVSAEPGTGLELRLSLAAGGPLLVRAEAGDGGRALLVPGLQAVLVRLRERGFSGEDLNRARLQWRSSQAALALHPQALVEQLANPAQSPGLEAAVAALTVQELNGLLARWLQPARLRGLLLGADPSLIKAAQQAGFAPIIR